MKMKNMRRHRPTHPQCLDTCGIQTSNYRLFGLSFSNVQKNWPTINNTRTVPYMRTRGRMKKETEHHALSPKTAIMICYLISGSSPSNSGAEKNSPSVMSSPSQIILIVMSLGFRLLP